MSKFLEVVNQYGTYLLINISHIEQIYSTDYDTTIIWLTSGARHVIPITYDKVKSKVLHGVV